MLVVRLRLWLLMVLLASGQVLLLAETVTSPPAPSQFATLGWKQSSSSTAKGYYVCWGFASGEYTNRLDVGNVTNVTLGGLNTKLTYYFSVVVYDGTGQEGPLSNEVQYHPAPNLSMELQSLANPNTPVRLSFQGNAGEIYQIQATGDFQQWDTLWSTNCVADGPLVFEAMDRAMYPFRFYRLARQ